LEITVALGMKLKAKVKAPPKRRGHDRTMSNQQRERPYGRLLRPPERCKTPTIRALRRAGFPFRLAGYFVKPGRGATVVTCVLDVAPDMPGLYIWAIDGSGLYVGDTRSLRLRNQTHGRYQGRNQLLCTRELRKAVARGKTVKIYVLEDPHAKWNGMTISVRKSLEHALLLQWLFPWNRDGRGLPTPNKPGHHRKAKIAVGEQL
jgi:hypothetical protein